jgi:hypothetical protein
MTMARTLQILIPKGLNPIESSGHVTPSQDMLWSRVMGDQPASVSWGQFHRSDRAQCAAVTPWVQEIMDVSMELVRLFGVNQGKILFRSAAEELQVRPLSVDTMGGTRRLASLSHAPANLCRNYVAYHRSLSVSSAEAYPKFSYSFFSMSCPACITEDCPGFLNCLPRCQTGAKQARHGIPDSDRAHCSSPQNQRPGLRDVIPGHGGLTCQY